MFNTNGFQYRIYSQVIENAHADSPEDLYGPGLVIFIHIECEDQINPAKSIRKAINNITWLAKKTNRNQVILHSFSHLSDSRADAAEAEHILTEISQILKKKGYISEITPFGFFMEFNLNVRGESLAKVWKSI